MSALKLTHKSQYWERVRNASVDILQRKLIPVNPLLSDIVRVPG